MVDLQPRKKVFCRLCGCNCQNNVCVDLGEEGGDSVTEKQRHYTLKKLARLNISADEPWLPTTICFVCEKRLSDAYDFVLQTDKAKNSLNLLLDVKSESDNDSFVDSGIHDSFSEKLRMKYEGSINEHVIIESHIDLICNDTGIKHETCIENNTEVLSEDIFEAVEIESTFHSEDDFEERFEPLTYTWADYSWSCLFCVNQFPTFEEFREHSITQHKVCNAYECTYCEKAMFCLDRFLKHVTKHRGYLKDNCYQCWESNVMLWHRNTHTSEFMCSGCNTGFNTIEEKATHKKEHNINVYSPFTPLVKQLSDNLTCRNCKKKFNSKTKLQKHIITVHNKGYELVCDRCGATVHRLCDLKQHIKCQHSEQQHVCKICKVTFTTLIGLKKHIPRHAQEYSFICNECGKGFTTRSKLIGHIVMHSNDFAFKCTECPKAFRRKLTLKVHMRQHTGEKPYECGQCNKAFTNCANFRKHLKRIHKVENIQRVVVKEDNEDDTNEILKWKEEVFKKRPWNWRKNKM